MLKLNSLTSFRFAAALMVYLSHSVSVFHDYQMGYVGVSFFFVLSGFILIYNYQSKFTELNKNHIKKFYVARFSKIYPVHLLTFLLALPYFLIRFYHFDRPLPGLPEFVAGFFGNLFMVHSFFPVPFGTIPYSFNPVSWSLSDEAFFYAVFPFIVYFFLKLRINQGVGRNLASAVVFYLGVVALALLAESLRGVHKDDWFYYVFPLFRCLDFMMGMLIGMIFVTVQKQKQTVNKTLFSYLEVFALCLLLPWLLLSPYIGQAFRFSVYFIPIWCLTIYIFAFQAGLISKWLSHKWLVFLGEISFSFYMVHLLIVNYVGLLPMNSIANHLITFVGSIVVSSLMYLLYEEPMRKKIRFGLRKREAALEYKTAVSP